MRMCLAVTMVAAIMAMGNSALGTGSVADFDDLSLAAESYWNGADSSGDFTSGPASFSNTYASGYWEGFAYSNLSQETPPLTGWSAAEFTAVPGSGQASANYVIGFSGFYGALPTMTLDQAVQLQGAYFTNNNWAYYSMLNGDGFAKQFGGASGDDADWFLLTIEGFDSANESTTVDFYLADYRFAENSQDYIVAGWTWVDLSGLGEVAKLTFNLSSSDVGGYGMNTPAYFAVDSFVMAPEPTTCLLMGIGATVLLYRKH